MSESEREMRCVNERERKCVSESERKSEVSGNEQVQIWVEGSRQV